MRTSEQINELAGALAAAQQAFPAIKKTKTAKVRMRAEKGGGEYTYSYADLADIFEAVRPILGGQGVAIVQVVVGTEQGFDLVTRLIHKGGQWIETAFPLQMKGTIQEIGSELTYTRRYALCGILAIAAEEDDDGQGATDKKQTTQQRPAPAQRPPARVPPKSPHLVLRELVLLKKVPPEKVQEWYAKAHVDGFDKMKPETISMLIKVVEQMPTPPASNGNGAPPERRVEPVVD